MLRMTALATDIAAKCASARFRALPAAKRYYVAKAALEIRAAWAKERDELEANESKATPFGGKAAFSTERREVSVIFD